MLFLSFGTRVLFTLRTANHMQILLSRNDFVTWAHNKLICNGNKLVGICVCVCVYVWELLYGSVSGRLFVL